MIPSHNSIVQIYRWRSLRRRRSIRRRGFLALGYLILKDAETGEVVEINTGDERKRRAFQERQVKAQSELRRLLLSARIDSIQLRTNESYTSALGRFFETREKRRRHG